LKENLRKEEAPVKEEGGEHRLRLDDLRSFGRRGRIHRPPEKREEGKRDKGEKNSPSRKDGLISPLTSLR